MSDVKESGLEYLPAVIEPPEMDRMQREYYESMYRDGEVVPLRIVSTQEIVPETRDGCTGRRTALSALTAVMLLAASGCTASTGTTPTSTTPSSTATPTSAVIPPELIFSEASSLGLLRTDALTVSGPNEVSTRGRSVRVDFAITLPANPPGRSVRIDWSGDCTLEGDATRTFDMPTGSMSATAGIQLRVPPGQADCQLRADSLIAGATYTGAGMNVTVTR